MKVLTKSKYNGFLYLLLYIPCFLIGRDLDNDSWFILNSGRYILQNGFVHTEPFTIHKGMSFVMQQWLSAVTFWSIYSILGEAGLISVVILFYILFSYMTFKLCMFFSECNFLLSYGISFIVICLLYISGSIVERPHIFLFMILLIEIYSLEKYIKSYKFVYLLPLLILSILLINLEAAMWPILFVILLPYLIDSFKFKIKFIEGQGYSKKGLFFIMLGMIAAGFINPYGIGAVTYLFNSYGFSEISAYISEMKCADINTPLGKIIFGTILLVIFAIFIYRKGNYKLRYYLLSLGTAYMSISSVRSYSIFIICGIIPLSYYFKDCSIKKLKEKNDKKTLLIRKILIVLLLISLTFVMYKKYTYIDAEHQDLVKSTDYLDKFNKSKIKLYTGFNEGGYLEFRGYKVYIDPRAEIFLKSNNKKYDIMKEYILMLSGKIYYKEVLNKYNFTHLLVSKNDILDTYLPYDKDYKIIYSSYYYKIYENVNLSSPSKT